MCFAGLMSADSVTTRYRLIESHCKGLTGNIFVIVSSTGSLHAHVSVAGAAQRPPQPPRHRRRSVQTRYKVLIVCNCSVNVYIRSTFL